MMFQSFEASTRPEQGPPRLSALRDAMGAERLDGFLVPRADAHQGEYVAPRDERLAWLTGFTGSAGFCAVLADRAGVFLDGRYRLQGKAQMAEDFSVVPWPDTKLADWLRDGLRDGQRLGFDPWLHTVGEIDALRKALQGSGIELVPVDNLVDRIWDDQPAPPAEPITPHPLTLAGQSAADKCATLAERLREAGQRAVVLTLPDSIAWLLNIRGSDIAHNPVPHGFAVLHDDGHVSLYTDPAKLDEALLAHLGDTVRPRPTEAFLPALRSLSGPVRLDRTSVPVVVAEEMMAAGIEIAYGDDPCLLPKARKNPAELAGMRAAHLRDGAAMCEFLAWLDTEAPNGGLTEIDVATRLEGFRRATNALRDISFDTIAGAGPHGAIVHYRVTHDTNRPVTSGELLLVDSGGQYADGTTDITRTIAVGEVGDEEKTAFTRVLKGMIAISRLRWPKGLAGQHLDALARYPLWLAGQDYDHGTGHGVGAFLSVHEGPHRLSRVSDVPLEPGMILSNEPGYYREGAFGIRIENLVAVAEAPPLPGGDDRAMLCFETLTWAPIDRRLIRVDMLSSDECDWLNAYHAETAEKIAAQLSAPAADWLHRATAPF